MARTRDCRISLSAVNPIPTLHVMLAVVVSGEKLFSFEFLPLVLQKCVYARFYAYMD